jgi:hypothetical protein
VIETSVAELYCNKEKKMTEFAVFIFVIIIGLADCDVGAYFKQGTFRKPGKSGPWVVASRK